MAPRRWTRPPRSKEPFAAPGSVSGSGAALSEASRHRQRQPGRDQRAPGELRRGQPFAQREHPGEQSDHRHGVPFEERDIESSLRARAEWSAIDGYGVPLTLVGQQIAYGLRQGQLQIALAAARWTAGGPAR